MPVLYVLDKTSREIIRIEESFSSLVWTERYQEAGDFVLDISNNVSNIDVYKRGNYVIIDESDEIMIIEKVDVQEDTEEPVLKISGRSLASILMRRVNASKVLTLQSGSISYSGNYHDVVTSILNDDIISPKKQTYKWTHKDGDSWVDGYDQPNNSRAVIETIDDPGRAISNFTISDTVPSSITLDLEYTELKTIYDILNNISKKSVTGFNVRFSGSNGFVCNLYKGTDRTSSQKTLDPVIFSPIMDNISYVNYLEDQTDYKNYMISYNDSGVDTEDAASIYNKYSWVRRTNSTQASGIDRYEVPFRANSSEDTTMLASGKEEFEKGDYDLVKVSEGEIDPYVKNAFGENYFLGDMVDITNENGVVMTAVISEVVRSYDTDGFIVTPNFQNMQEYDYGEEETT